MLSPLKNLKKELLANCTEKGKSIKWGEYPTFLRGQERGDLTKGRTGEGRRERGLGISLSLLSLLFWLLSLLFSPETTDAHAGQKKAEKGYGEEEIKRMVAVLVLRISKMKLF